MSRDLITFIQDSRKPGLSPNLLFRRQSWVLICSQLDLEPGKSVQVKTYHPSTLQIIPLTFTPKEPAPIQVAGQEIVYDECDVRPIKNTFWISKDGRFVKVKQGDLEITLAE